MENDNMKKLLCFLLVLIAVTGYAQDPMRFGSRSGGGTFTGGTLTDNLIMSSGKYIGFGTGSLASLTFRLTGEAGSGVYFGTKLAVLCLNGGEFLKVDGVNFNIQTGVKMVVGTAANNAMVNVQALSYTDPAYTFNNTGKSGMSSGAIREASMIASGTESMRFLATGTYTPGFSQFGAGSPALKCKRLTGTLPDAALETVTVAHGLSLGTDMGNLVSFSACAAAGGALVAEDYRDPAYDFYVYVQPTTVTLSLGASATTILNGTYSVLLWYTE